MAPSMAVVFITGPVRRVRVPLPSAWQAKAGSTSRTSRPRGVAGGRRVARASRRQARERPQEWRTSKPRAFRTTTARFSARRRPLNVCWSMRSVRGSRPVSARASNCSKSTTWFSSRNSIGKPPEFVDAMLASPARVLVGQRTGRLGRRPGGGVRPAVSRRDGTHGPAAGGACRSRILVVAGLCTGSACNGEPVGRPGGDESGARAGPHAVRGRRPLACSPAAQRSLSDRVRGPRHRDVVPSRRAAPGARPRYLLLIGAFRRCCSARPGTPTGTSSNGICVRFFSGRSGSSSSRPSSWRSSSTRRSRLYLGACFHAGRDRFAAGRRRGRSDFRAPAGAAPHRGDRQRRMFRQRRDRAGALSFCGACGGDGTFVPGDLLLVFVAVPRAA